MLENYDNLISFLPSHVFYGQKPCIWWTKRHDIDLLRGTYKHGYANYVQIRSHPTLSFCKLQEGIGIYIYIYIYICRSRIPRISKCRYNHETAKETCPSNSKERMWLRKNFVQRDNENERRRQRIHNIREKQNNRFPNYKRNNANK